MHINIVPSQPYLFHPEMHPILIPVEIHRFFPGRHLDPRQKSALPTSQEFLAVSNMPHPGQRTASLAWARVRLVSGDRHHLSYLTVIMPVDQRGLRLTDNDRTAST